MKWMQALSFLCMGWLSFLLVFTVGRDVLLLAAAVLPPLAAMHTLLDESGAAWVPVAALAAVCVGALAAAGEVPTSVASIFPWRGWRRISTDSGSCRSAICTPVRRCGSQYVQRVVDHDEGARAGSHRADRRHRGRVGAAADAPRRAARALASGDRAFFVLGNHDYYSGAARGRRTSKRWDFRVLRTPMSPSRVARHAS